MFFVRLPTNYLPTSFSSRFNDSLTSWKIGIVVESVETEETMENFSSSQFFPIRFSAPWRRERSYMRVRKLTLEPTFIPDNASLGRDTSLSLSLSFTPPSRQEERHWSLDRYYLITHRPSPPPPPPLSPRPTNNFVIIIRNVSVVAVDPTAKREITENRRVFARQNRKKILRVARSISIERRVNIVC